VPRSSCFGVTEMATIRHVFLIVTRSSVRRIRVRRQRNHAAGTPALATGLELREDVMLLQNQNAVIYGGGGAIGGAVARAFAREGARFFLSGRNALLGREKGEKQ
jgi:hypothetical protein